METADVVFTTERRLAIAKKIAARAYHEVDSWKVELLIQEFHFILNMPDGFLAANAEKFKEWE